MLINADIVSSLNPATRFQRQHQMVGTQNRRDTRVVKGEDGDAPRTALLINRMTAIMELISLTVMTNELLTSMRVVAL
jgi:hypothetical protein